MTAKTKIVLDADVIIHFVKAGQFSLLLDIFPEYQYIILDVVYDELPVLQVWHKSTNFEIVIGHCLWRWAFGVQNPSCKLWHENGTDKKIEYPTIWYSCIYSEEARPLSFRECTHVHLKKSLQLPKLQAFILPIPLLIIVNCNSKTTRKRPFQTLWHCISVAKIVAETENATVKLPIATVPLISIGKVAI